MSLWKYHNQPRGVNDIPEASRCNLGICWTLTKAGQLKVWVGFVQACCFFKTSFVSITKKPKLEPVNQLFLWLRCSFHKSFGRFFRQPSILLTYVGPHGHQRTPLRSDDSAILSLHFSCFAVPGEKKFESAAAPRLPPVVGPVVGWVSCELRIRMGGLGSVQFRYLDLFKVFLFNGFYHGKSPLFTTMWGIYFCSNHRTSKSPRIKGVSEEDDVNQKPDKSPKSGQGVTKNHLGKPALWYIQVCANYPLAKYDIIWKKPSISMAFSRKDTLW